MCCQETKPSGEAAGAFVYKTNDPKLLRAMQTAGGPRVGTYVLCSACVGLYPNDVLHKKITAKFAQAGLFGPTMAGTSRVEHRKLPGALELRQPDSEVLVLGRGGHLEKQNLAPPPEDPWLTLAGAAKYTHLSKGFLSNVIRRGELRASHIGAGKQRHHYLLRQSWIDAWIESRASGGSV
jgi:excisionase family DNA binding protein